MGQRRKHVSGWACLSETPRGAYLRFEMRQSKRAGGCVERSWKLEEKERGSSRSRHTCAQNSGANAKARLPSFHPSFVVRSRLARKRYPSLPPSYTSPFCSTAPPPRRAAPRRPPPSLCTRFPCILSPSPGASRAVTMKKSNWLQSFFSPDLVQFHDTHFRSFYVFVFYRRICTAASTHSLLLLV